MYIHRQGMFALSVPHYQPCLPTKILSPLARLRDRPRFVNRQLALHLEASYCLTYASTYAISIWVSLTLWIQLASQKVFNPLKTPQTSLEGIWIPRVDRPAHPLQEQHFKTKPQRKSSREAQVEAWQRVAGMCFCSSCSTP